MNEEQRRNIRNGALKRWAKIREQKNGNESISSFSKLMQKSAEITQDISNVDYNSAINNCIELLILLKQIK